MICTAEFFSRVFAPQWIHTNALSLCKTAQTVSGGSSGAYLKTRIDFEIERDAERTLTSDPNFTYKHCSSLKRVLQSVARLAP